MPPSIPALTAQPSAWPRTLLLAAAVALCYANSLDVPFLFDDPRPDFRLDYSTRPLVSASFALNRALGSGTGSYHVFNALVHLACGLLLLGILHATLARAAPDLAARTRAGLALVATLLWLCHPLQTEAVTYLSQRAEALGACFYLLVLYAFQRSASSARPLAWQTLALLALALGFATKETIATAPLVVILYDAVFLAPGPLAALRQRPRFYAALALVTLGLALAFVAPLLWAEHTTAGLKFEGFGPLEYARTQPGVLLHYVRLAFWPHPLVFDYGWPIAERARDFLPQSIVLVALLAASVVLLVRRSWLGFVATAFFLVLAPTSSIVPIKDPAFEHRMYLPLAALALLAVMGAWWGLARLGERALRRAPVLAFLGVLALAGLTIRRNQDYRSAVRLMESTVACAPLNARAHANLGTALLDEGRAEEAVSALMESLRLDPYAGLTYLNLGYAFVALEQVERAIPLYRRAEELVVDSRCPDYLGYALTLKGDYAEAARCFQRALDLKPYDPAIHCQLASALAHVQRSEEALQHYQEALRLAPGTREAHVSLAALLAELKQPSAALEHAQRALELPAGSAREELNLGLSLRALGRLDLALSAFSEASRMAPAMPEPCAAFAETVSSKPDASPDERRTALRMAQRAIELTHSERREYQALLAKLGGGADEPGEDPDWLGRALFRKGDAAGAAAQFQRALAAHPDDAGLHYRLACALGELRRPSAAIEHYLEALRLDPNHQEAHINLGALLAEQGRADEAVEHARLALAIAPNSAEEHFNLAQALRALGRLDEALQAFEEATRLAPEKPELLAAFAKTVCMKTDASPAQREEALRRARRANELVGAKRADILETCALAHAALGEYEEAVRLVDEALELPGPAGNAVFAERLRAQRADYLGKTGG